MAHTQAITPAQPTPSAEAPLVELVEVERTYGEGEQLIRALDRVSLRIDTGEVVAVMGASGSGKSTLMNVIGCLDRPTDGTYLLEGVDVGRESNRVRALLRNHVFGFVFQSYNLIARMAAVEQVGLPLLYQGARDINERSLAALEAVGMGERARHSPSQLSGGQQQRVAIARSLVVNPRIILADEPTGALDTRTSREIMELFLGLAEEQGITLVIVTHEPLVAAYARRLIRMQDGQVIEDLRDSDVAHALEGGA
ncbi:MAG: ABC transporter ATP-binding protein [Dehalococcoidia bacterium]|nr:ABC transporter ATP-binding protein [Dehalococcoidia bacterium]